MKHHFLKAAMLTAILCPAMSANAQRHVSAISHNPVNDPGIARSNLFKLPDGDSAYYFRANLPSDNFLVIRFGRLSYWQSGMIPEIFALAKSSWGQMRDSFAGSTTARRLSVHVPPSNYPIVAAVAEYGAEEKLVLLKGQKVQPLRIAVDTLNILKTLAGAKDDTTAKRQIQYTFLMKDLAEIEALADNDALVQRIERSFDSLVAVYRARWKNQDASYHSLEASYDVRNEQGGRLQTTRPGSLLNSFDVSGELGTSFVAGTIAPFGVVRLTYQWPEKGEDYSAYVGLSFSSIGFVHQVNNELALNGQGFLNVEFGALSSGSRKPHFYQSSLGVGYRIAQRGDEGPYKFKYRMFFNYSLSKAITVTPDFYFIPKNGDEQAKTFGGLSLGVRLF